MALARWHLSRRAAQPHLETHLVGQARKRAFYTYRIYPLPVWGKFACGHRRWRITPI